MADNTKVYRIQFDASKALASAADVIAAAAKMDAGLATAGSAIADVEAALTTAGSAAASTAAGIGTSTKAVIDATAAFRGASVAGIELVKANSSVADSYAIAQRSAAGYARASTEAARQASRDVMAAATQSAEYLKSMYGEPVSAVSKAYASMSAAAKSYAADVSTTVAKLNVADAYQGSINAARQYTAEVGKAVAATNGLASQGRAGPAPMTANQKMILGYQLNDIFTQVVSGSPLPMIAAQQGPQITQIFGGISATLSRIPVGLLAAGGTALGAAAILGTVTALKDLNDGIETEKRHLGDVLGDQRLAAQSYADIRAQAAAAGEAIDKVTTSYVQFSRAGVSVGATGGQVAGLTSIVSQLGKLGGVSDSQQSAAASALAQALKESTVSASSLDTILENMPGLGRRIADGLGMSVTQLRLMAQSGDITNHQVFDGLLSQSAKVSADLKATGITLGGFFSSALQTASDLAVAIYKIASNIELVSSKADAARRAAAANSNRPTAATPRVIGANGGSLTLEEQITSNEASEIDPAVLNNAKTITNQLLDLQRAAGAAAGEAVLSAAKIADQLDPTSSELKTLQQQIDATTKGLDGLQSGLSGLDATQAAAQTKRLTDSLQFLQDKSTQATSAYGQALDAVTKRQGQNEIGMTPGQRGYQDRVQQLTRSQPGVSNEAAGAVVDAQQLQSLDDMIAKQQLELITQQAMTQAMRGGKAAADQMAVAMMVLGISFDQLGNITPELQVKLDLLADLMEKKAAEMRTQASIDASKPIVAELNGIAAAMKVVEQGSYAMQRAQEAAKAAANDNGTGGLEMQVFDAKQGLTDAVTVSNLKKQTDLQNALASAAGNVSAQKKIQLDYDIKIAQQAAGPGATQALADGMRAKAASDLNLEVADGAAEMERQIDLTKQQAALVRSGSADYAVQLAQLQKKNELLAKGVDVDNSADAQRQITDAGNLARAQTDLQRAQDSADQTKRIWQNAYDNIQTFGADTFFNIFTGAAVNGADVATQLKNIFLRSFAEIAAAAIIRPIISPIFAGASQLLGMGGTAASFNAPASGGGGTGGLGGFSMPSLGMGGSLGFLSQPIVGADAVNTASMTASLTNTPMSSLSTLGGLTWGQGLGAAAGLGMGAYQLATNHSTAGTIGGIASLVGAGVSLIPGVGQIAGPIIGLLGGLLPGLFGGQQKPPPKQATGGLNYVNGQFVGTGSQYGGADSVLGTLGGVGNTLQGLLGAAGVTARNGNASLNYQTFSQDDFSNATTLVDGKQWGQGSNATDTGLDTAAAHIAHEIMMQTDSGISDIMRQGLDTFSHQNADHAFSTQDLGTAVQELTAFEAAIKNFGLTATAAQQAIEQIDSSFDGLYQTAQKYGLDTSVIDAEKRRQEMKYGTDFADNIQSQILQINDPTAAQYAQVDKDTQTALDNNAYMVKTIAGYVDQTTQIEELAALKRKQIADDVAQAQVEASQAAQQAADQAKQSVQGLQDLLHSLQYGDLSTATPEATLQGTQAAYQAALAQSRAGDATASANLQGLTQSYIQAAKDFYGSSGGFQAINQSTQADLIERISVLGSPGGTNDNSAQFNAVMQSNGETMAQMSSLMNQVASLTQQVAELTAALRRAA